MLQIDDSFIIDKLDFPSLINALRQAFKEQTIVCPPKEVYDYKSTVSSIDNSMLIMPAWDNSQYFGVKLISATPSNAQTEIPYLNGIYLLFDATTGLPYASMDAKLITHMRTAATSALAAGHLAVKGASSVLVIGNGQIAPYFIRAYDTLPGIKDIYLWGRNHTKSKDIVSSLPKLNARVQAIDQFEEFVTDVDIISFITSARSPIIHVDQLRAGQHIDLAGSFTPDMIEVSTDIVENSDVYVDNLDVTPHHAGELVQAIQEGIFKMSSIKGDLQMLCADEKSKRRAEAEITLFKSTGMAIEDFVIAKLILKKRGA